MKALLLADAVCGSAPYAENAPLYIGAGYSPIPEKPGTKRPAISEWSGLCDGPPTKEEAARWAAMHPGAGIALACGYNGLIAIDIDTDEAAIQEAVKKALPEITIAKRGQKGFTAFFRFLHGPAPTAIFKGKGAEPGKPGKPLVEILGHGRKTTIPPSIHPGTGEPYEWVNGQELLNVHFNDLPELPGDIEARLEEALRPWLADKPSWGDRDHSFEARHHGEFSDDERKRYESHARGCISGRAADLAATGEGGRNIFLFTSACYLGKFASNGLVDGREIESALVTACETNGLLKEDGRASVLATIRSGLKRAKNDPLPLLAERPYPGDAPVAPLDKAPDTWERPEPLVSRVEPLAYPVDALPLIVREAVMEAQATIMAPVALVAACALSAMSTATQALVDVERMNGLYGPVSLFFLTLAMSGDRKSTADKLFTAEIRQYQREQAKKHAPEITAFRADFQAWEHEGNGIREAIKRAARSDTSKKGKTIAELQSDLRSHEASKPPEPRVPRLIRADITSESLAWALAKEWPSAAIISSEAGIVFGGHAMGADAIMRNLALQNTLWDGADHYVDRRTKDSFAVRDVRLTVGLQVQEGVLHKFCEQSGPIARDTGYFARFLFSWPKSIQGEREIRGEPPKTLPAVEAFNRRVKALLNTPVVMDGSGALSTTLLSLTPEGKKVWIEFHNEIERDLRPDGDLRDIRDVASKAADNIARLAAIFHVFEHGASGGVDAVSVQRAGAIVVWHLNEARRFFGELSLPTGLAAATRLEAWLIERCKKNRTNVVRRQDIQNSGPGGLRDGKMLNAAIEELQELGRARFLRNGKRREIYVNPAVLGGAQ